MLSKEQQVIETIKNCIIAARWLGTASTYTGRKRRLLRNEWGVGYYPNYLKPWAAAEPCFCPMGAVLLVLQPPPSPDEPLYDFRYSCRVLSAAEALGVSPQWVIDFTNGWDTLCLSINGEYYRKAKGPDAIQDVREFCLTHPLTATGMGRVENFASIDKWRERQGLAPLPHY